MTSSLASDNSIRLAKLVGEIEYHRLGEPFIAALYKVVIGGLQPDCQTAQEVWQITKSRTDQRIQAAEQVLRAHGVDIQ